MGIQDRDYMRERNRNSAFDREPRRDSPFTPPAQGPSVLVMVLTWVSIAFLLYRAYTWLGFGQHTPPRPSVNRAVASSAYRNEARQVQSPNPSYIAPPQQVISNVPARNESPAPQVRYLPREEVRPEAPAPQSGNTIYLCNAYSGGAFWSQAHCGEHRALIERIFPVPAGLPFEQQVQLAEQHRRDTAPAVYSAPVQVSTGITESKARDCKALDAEVERLDAMARQPQSGPMQDWIREKRQAARDRQFALHC